MSSKYTNNFNDKVGNVVSGENNTININETITKNSIYYGFSQLEINLMKNMEVSNPGLLAKIGNKALELGIDFSATFCAALMKQ